MKRILAMVLVVAMVITMAACGGKAEKIDDFSALEVSKFHGFINGDGDFLVMYEAAIDEAVMGAVLMTDDGTSVTLSEETIVKNPDGNSLLFFEEVDAEVGDIISLTLEKEGYETLAFDVTVE